ncbi:DUF3772 domain-containing protein [Methylomagnum ishizawai]|uniref:DUF3772 domain-containing protein n=1 Tax=Methylomagnum ishizawai TaxID=1760988 RepID=UPI001C343249|nr:DUF3772 domain-containing protein [Methylomagnum ishizawai]BBL73122.1 mechanosensitive ion channel protein MscS [Methylomagnum ishizawai]
MPKHPIPRIHPIHGLPILLSLTLSAAGLAQTADVPNPGFRAQEWQKSLDEAEKATAEPNIPDGKLADWRDRLLDLIAQAREAVHTVEPDIQTLRGDLEALGPAPAAGAAPEAANVVARRKELNAGIASLEGVVKEADLASIRAGRLLAGVKATQRTRFTGRILTRSPSPLSPAIWGKALPELGSALASLYRGLVDKATPAAILAIGRPLALGMALAALLAFPLRAGLIRKFGYIVVEDEPTYMQRLWTALFTGLVRTLLPTAAALAVYLGLLYTDWPGEAMADVLRVGLLSLTALFFVTGFARSALAPDQPDWRLVPIHDPGARTLNRTVTGLAILFALDRVLGELANQYDVSVELVSTQKSVFGALISLALLKLLGRGIWPEDPARPGWNRVRYGLMLLIAAIPASAMLGYVALSRLLATQWVLTLGLYATVALLNRIAQEAVEHALNPASPQGQRLRAALALGEEGAEMLAFWVVGLMRCSILLLAALALPLLWGVPGKDIAAWLGNAFMGFKLGNLNLSLGEILVALLSFTGLLLATRMLQKALDQRIFPKTRLDPGVRNSIRSGLGYAGFALALMIAVSILGLDLSNLAMIAGALSVGIGFGLQNIVNNFVSGLILLVERPIKAGDWVVVGEYQGYVKKISVRATEISTFDRASVFIPNSSLISGTVMNRTYADKTGRVLLPIGLAYHADPHKARRVLLDIALGHPDIRDNPPPSVFFQSFGDSALNLELVAVLHDVDKVKQVTSDLCFAVHEAFQREGIEIPFPQRDIKLSLDEEQLRRYLRSDHRGQETPKPPMAQTST